ncbi:MAG: DUF2147 domain-containing protein [Betaproteobacteria bacterium]
MDIRRHIRFPHLALASVFVCGAISLGATTGYAQTTPAGLWKTIDDESGRPKALVRIHKDNGSFIGRIEALLDFNDPDNPICRDCPDERRNKPILGMTILRATKIGTDVASIIDGDILDPENGKVYRVRVTLGDDGRTLDLRGYVGIPLFGRTQTWVRAD